MTITPATLEKLARYDTPTICNVIELFEVRPRNTGYMDSRVRSNFPEMLPMVGFACTAQFRSDTPPAGGGAYGSLDQQISLMSDLPGPAVMVFQDVDDPPVGAVFGEVMCSTYRGFGSVGLVTNGGGRDLEQVRELKYPVFTGSTICAHAYCHLIHLGLPVRVGGLMVNQNDLLHGDANGVTHIPVDIAGEVADIAGEYITAEEIIIDYVKGGGEKSVETLKERQNECHSRIDELKRQVCRKENRS